MAKKLLTPDEVKAWFEARGVPVARWARERGYPPLAVYQVLNGFSKYTRGQAHKIAVDLGMKHAGDTASPEAPASQAATA